METIFAEDALVCRKKALNRRVRRARGESTSKNLYHRGHRGSQSFLPFISLLVLGVLRDKSWVIG
jgi:hypothetical protein